MMYFKYFISITVIIFIQCNTNKTNIANRLNTFNIQLENNFEVINILTGSSFSDNVNEFSIKIAENDIRNIFNDISKREYFQKKENKIWNLDKFAGTQIDTTIIRSYLIKSGIALEQYSKNPGYAYSHILIEMDSVKNILNYSYVAQ